MQKFVGAIAFLDSDVPDRITKPGEFEVISDWFISVRDYFTQEVITGNYDGTAVLITVYKGTAYDGEVMGSLVIANPYYA